MASKLQFSFSDSAPKGDFATICLIGSNGELIPHLDKDEAAGVIAAMATAQFKGGEGKVLTVYRESAS